MKNWTAFGVFLCVNACAVNAGAQQMITKGSWILESNDAVHEVFGTYASADLCKKAYQLINQDAQADVAQDTQIINADNQNMPSIQQGEADLQQAQTASEAAQIAQNAICVQQ